MHPNTATDYPDINFKQIYRGHKCSIDMDSSVWHDTSDLVEFPNLDQFLKLYRGCGLNEAYWNWEAIVKPATVLPLLNMCKKCPHSKNALKNKSTTEGVYCLPNDKTHYASCPLEKHFAEGVELHIDYLPRFNIVCNHCQRTVSRPYAGKTSRKEFFDVRLKGTPAKLVVYRSQELCPHCRKHIAVDLIPNIQVDSKYEMPIRLIHAINDYSTQMGISGFCKKHIAQGYGISNESLKNFFKGTLEGRRRKAEHAYLDYAKSRGKIKAHADFMCKCISPNYSMFLFFSTVAHDTASTEFCLGAAIDEAEVEVIDSWAHGDFSSSLPPKLTDHHLDYLAGHCARIAFPNTDHLLAFRMTQLVIAYGKFLKSRRYAVEDPEITETLLNCLLVLAVGDMDFHEFERLIERIASWSLCSRKQRIYRAARRVLSVLDTYYMYPFSASLRTRIQPSVQPPTKENIDQAERIVYLIERSLISSAQWQTASDEDPEECYGTNSELAISRLLHVNPAVSYDHQDDSYIGTPLYGVPAAALEELLKNGLLDERGRPLADLPYDTPVQ